MFNCVVSTTPVNGLEPLGARPSAGTVMTNFGSICRHGNQQVLIPYISMGLVFQGWAPDSVFCSPLSIASHVMTYCLSKFVISTVPADGLAPLGARPSAGTVMTSFSLVQIYRHCDVCSHIYVWDWHFKGETRVCFLFASVYRQPCDDL